MYDKVEKIMTKNLFGDLRVIKLGLKNIFNEVIDLF